MYIKINSIAVKSIIGCYAHERSQTQDLLIDVGISLYSHNWMHQDKLDTTVDYDQLIDNIKAIVTKTQYNLLESLVQYLTQAILDNYCLVKEVHVVITKLAICGVKAGTIQVSDTRHRQFKVALALGSNCEMLPQQQLITAIEILGEYINDIKIGGIYETKPVGFTDQANFYNTAIIGYTNLKPEELLGKIKSIEKLMGKTEVIVNGPRIIDIDLILFDDMNYTHNFLTVPHKRAHLRDFVLKPLADVAPHWLHPTLAKTMVQLVNELPDNATSILKRVDYYKDADAEN